LWVTLYCVRVVLAGQVDNDIRLVADQNLINRYWYRLVCVNPYMQQVGLTAAEGSSLHLMGDRQM
jgi:hypothetical protein